MPDDPHEALAIFAEGVRQLLQIEELVYADPAERALVARLAILLDGKFEGWSIGVDWNRYETEVKRLRHQLPGEDFEREGAIVPDLIVHRVGQRENLLVVEVKKAINRDYGRDIWKLRGLTAQDGDYGYAAGLHLVLDMKSQRVERCDVFVDGEHDEGLTAWLEEQLP